MAGKFREIEHKFLVDDATFDPASFRNLLLSLNPERTVTEHVRDIYYRFQDQPGYIYRHRYDRQLQHLTVKSIGGDTEDRLEVNLDLGRHRGDQKEAVERFLSVRPIAWKGTIHKDIEVFYFPDCEIVYYTARSEEKAFRCVEFESRGEVSLEEARAILRSYERATGFEGVERERRSLVELMFGEV